MLIRSLAVFCGSKTGNNPLFGEATRTLGQLMAENDIGLVYGGGSVGLMGLIADTVLQHGGKAIGVIPQVLVDWEREHKGLTELFVVDDMHSRKKKMYDLCDAALVLPGGFGTLDELFEMVTWNQLSIHDRQLFVLNTDGFYNDLRKHIHRMEQEGFLSQEAVDRLTFLEQPEELIEYYKP